MKKPWWNKYIGIPFRARGRDISSGLDCYGLLIHVYREEFGISLFDYRYMYNQQLSPSDVNVALEEAQQAPEWHKIPRPIWAEGDVLLFMLGGLPFHTTILLPKERMLHCTTKAGVVIEPYTSSLWSKRLIGSFRHVKRQHTT